MAPDQPMQSNEPPLDAGLTTILKRIPDDPDAVGRIWEHFQRQMVRAFESHLQRRDVPQSVASAESVYDSAFLRIQDFARRQPQRFEDMNRDDFAGYLWRTMENLTKNRLKKRSAAVLPTDISDDTANQSHDHFVFQDTCQQICARIEERSRSEEQADRLKAILALRLCGQTYRQIADELGIGEKASEFGGRILKDIIRPLFEEDGQAI
ncbi:RNA polymerase sigma factor [Thalassoroseus pseudoceratinae]|uniref:RNA polymerase sigma factor n=1 Tax=Thalassoroseus pseudoceratinae TaxID=2713176 RepID=UPI0014222EDD|nr:sigma-70 family RNA polymerase sigma factor [Thalassoroseus pseudoceratinae]